MILWKKNGRREKCGNERAGIGKKEREWKGFGIKEIERRKKKICFGFEKRKRETGNDRALQ